MRKTLTVAFAAVLIALVATPAAGATGQLQLEAEIKAMIDAYVVAHPMDFEGIDALVYRYRHDHISVRAYGGDHDMTAAEAAAQVAASSRSDIAIASGIPAPQRYITTPRTTNGGPTSSTPTYEGFAPRRRARPGRLPGPGCAGERESLNTVTAREDRRCVRSARLEGAPTRARRARAASSHQALAPLWRGHDPEGEVVAGCEVGETPVAWSAIAVTVGISA